MAEVERIFYRVRDDDRWLNHNFNKEEDAIREMKSLHAGTHIVSSPGGPGGPLAGRINYGITRQRKGRHDVFMFLDIGISVLSCILYGRP